MNVLVTGGAGFIGSNFVRYWVRAASRATRVVAYDALTYAGNRPNLADVEDRISFVHGDVCDGELALATLREHDIDTWCTSRPSPTTAWPWSTPPGSSGPTCSAPRPCSRRPGTPGWRASTTSRRARSTATSPSTPTTPSPRTPLPAPHPVQRLEGGRRPRRAGLRRDLRSARHHHQLLEQLRAVPVPREGHPPVRRPRPRRPAAAAVRVDAEPAGVAARDRPLPGHRGRARTRPHRRDLPRRQRRGGEHRGDRRRRARALGKPESLKKIVPDRPGHDRRYLLDCTKITQELGWAPTIGFEEGLAETVRWYADNRAWWEPLIDRAPVVESSWGDASPGDAHRATVHRARPARTDAWGPRRFEGARHRRRRSARHRRRRRPVRAGARPGACAGDLATGRLGCGPPCEVVAADHARLDVTDRSAVLASSRACAPTWWSTPGRGRRSTPARATPTGPSPSTPWGRGTWPRRPGASGRHVVYVSTDYVFDGTSTASVPRVGRAQPMSVYGRSKLGGERELDPGSTVVRTSWVCGAHGANMVRTVLRLAGGTGPLRFVDDQRGSPTFTADLAGVLAVLATERLPGTFHVTNSRRDVVVRVRPGRARGGRATTRSRWSPSPRPSSTRPAPPRGRPTRPSTTPRCGSSGMPLLPDWHDGAGAAGGARWNRWRHRRRRHRDSAEDRTARGDHGGDRCRLRRSHDGGGPGPPRLPGGLWRVRPGQGAAALCGASPPSWRRAWARSCAAGSTRAGCAFVLGATEAVQGAEFVFLCVPTPRAPTEPPT